MRQKNSGEAAKIISNTYRSQINYDHLFNGKGITARLSFPSSLTDCTAKK
jgi:hypothetical protein